jgi:hypothetical protein
MRAATPFIGGRQGDFGMVVAMIVTALLWGLAILGFWRAKRLIKEGRKTQKQ